MPKRPPSSIFWEDSYLHLTHRPLNSLAFILAPLVVYQIYALRYGTELLAPRDVARMLEYFGATAGVLPPLLILAVLIGQHAAGGYPWRIQPVALGGMLLESLLWVLPMLGLSYLTWRVLAAGAAGGPSPFAQTVLQWVGAAIYEEFIFRVVLIGLLLLALIHLLGLRKELSAAIAILAAGVLFSLYHYSGQQLPKAGAFPWDAFIFRVLAGCYLGGLYVCRGFGIVVGAHAFWNVWVAYVSS